MSTYRSRAADQRVAEEVIAGQELMCAAQGCPHKWSVDAGAGKLCSWHAWSPPHRWPQITQERMDALAERAHRAQYKCQSDAKTLSRAEKIQVLNSLRDAVPAPVGRKDWAYRILQRAQTGARISPLVLKMAQVVAGRKTP